MIVGMAYCMAVVNKTVWVGCSDGSIRIYDKDVCSFELVIFVVCIYSI